MAKFLFFLVLPVLPEVVHVQLSDERGEVRLVEIDGEDLRNEGILVDDNEAQPVLKPGYRAVAGVVQDVPELFNENGRVVFGGCHSFFSSVLIIFDLTPIAFQWQNKSPRKSRYSIPHLEAPRPAAQNAASARADPQEQRPFHGLDVPGRGSRVLFRPKGQPALQELRSP